MKNDAGPFCSARVLICAVLCALVVPNAGAQSRQPLKVAYSAIGGPQAPFWVAKEAGHFERNGLQVQMIFIPSGTQVAQAMLSQGIWTWPSQAAHRWSRRPWLELIRSCLPAR